MLKQITFGTLALALSGCQPSESQSHEQATPEQSTHQFSGMVVTANPHATDAGVRILESGGSAVDAAISIQAVLSLVEPQSSGLGGGGFMLHYDSETRSIDVYDGRETAPSGATPDMFIKSSNEQMSFIEAKTSGLSIGVPGVVSLLNLAHQDHGNLNWNELFESAISLSEQGFEVSPRLAGFLNRFKQYIPSTPAEGPTEAYNYFYANDGSPKTFLQNHAYAESLRNIGNDPRWFYEGSIASEIAAAANATPRAGSLSIEDISGYSARKLEPLCTRYKAVTLCGPPPPSSWIAVGMTMGMLENAPRFLDKAERNRDWAIVGEALRLAYADRDQYLADDEFVEIPLAGLLHPEFLKSRALEIDPERAGQKVTHGDPWIFEKRTATTYGQDATTDQAGTTHFAVVDADGNAVTMTASVESVFGSTRMAGGMILNNQLTDFSRTALDNQGHPIANAVEPLKRPRSSMSPTIVLDENHDFLMSTGSPGGNSIIAYTLKTLVGVLDWGLSPQEAIELPNMVARGDTVRIENSRATTELIQSLKNYGFDVKESQGEISGLSLILRNSDGSLEGGVDPRREGTIGVPTQKTD